MQDPDTTFNHIKALRLVCKSLDVVCLPRVLKFLFLFGPDDEDVLGNFRHFNDVLSSNLSYTRTLVIPNWMWIHGYERFIAVRKLPGLGGAIGVILFNTLVASSMLFYRFVISPKILPVGIFHASIRSRAKFRLAFANEIGIRRAA
jgi:hypothetical protein